MPTQTMPSPLSTDVKRQVIYASLLRFAGEAQHLRDRAIDRIVLTGLSDTSREHPAKMGAIQAVISLGKAPLMRDETIHASLARLQKTGHVDYTRIRFKRAYFLTDKGNAEVQSASQASVQLLDAVLARMEKALPVDVPIDVASRVFRAFLCECFARLGLEIAKTVTGRIGRDDLMRMPQIGAAFKAAVQSESLLPHLSESIEARCAEFLRSTNPDDERLKLYLTQSFFFTQLLGMQGVRFDPLAEQAFAGAVFFLDTNALLPRVLKSEGAVIFDEMIAVAKRLGIEVRVTRATVNEARRVAADRERQLSKIVDTVPTELLRRAPDQFLEAFLERRETEGITVSEFMAPFERLPDFIATDLGLTFVDQLEEDVLPKLGDRDSIARIIQEESEVARRRRKSATTLDHDVFHFAIVRTEREQHPTTWFLTRDRSLIQAAGRLAAADQRPTISFSLTGFLQTISPFVTSAAAEHSLADVFSAMLADQIATGDSMYDVEELVVLADLHEDVLATRDEMLVQAIDIVRSRVLQGQPFRAENAQKVALELKKFLSSSVSDRERAATAERERLKGLLATGASRLEDEQGLRRAAEDEAEGLRREIAFLNSQVSALRTAEENNKRSLETLVATGTRRDQSVRRNRAIQGWMAGGAIVAVGGWIADQVVAGSPFFASHPLAVQRTIRVAGLMLVALPTTMYVRRTDWPEAWKTTALFAVFAVAYALLPGVKDGFQTILNDPLVWIAALISIVLAIRR